MVVCSSFALKPVGELNTHDNELVFDISRTDTFKYLAVTMDSHMRWEVRNENVTKTLRSMMLKFKYLIKLLHTHHLKVIYFSLVESAIHYDILRCFCLLKGWKRYRNEF